VGRTTRAAITNTALTSTSRQPTYLTEVNTVLSRLHVTFNQVQPAQNFRNSVQY